MNWFENLKSIINAKVDLSGLKAVKLIGDVKENALFKIDNSKTLVVNIESDAAKDPEKRKELKQVINDALNIDGQPILEAKAALTIDDFAKSDDYNETLEFLRDKIPAADIQILRAAVYMRIVHERGESVDKLKADIVLRHGQRGSNVSNLCTAGYFESYIIPMYKEFETRPNFSKDTFINYYNQIIDNAPFAIFVSRQQLFGEVKTALIEKMTFNKNYGIHILNVHAIGTENVKKVQEVLEDEEVRTFFTSEPAVTIEGNVLSAQLFF